MLEKEIEEKMRGEITQHGGLFLKFISPSMAGVPDRIAITAEGRIIFVELKRDGGKISPVQRYVHKLLRQRHVEVRTVIGMKEGMELVKEVFGGDAK